MRSTTLISAIQSAPGMLVIDVEPAHAIDLHGFLLGRGIKCTAPAATMFRPQRFCIDRQGRRQVKDETTVHEITVHGTMEDFELWMGEWIEQLDLELGKAPPRLV